MRENLTTREKVIHLKEEVYIHIIQAGIMMVSGRIIKKKERD
jgi:hypothetical protein